MAMINNLRLPYFFSFVFACLPSLIFGQSTVNIEWKLIQPATRSDTILTFEGASFDTSLSKTPFLVLSFEDCEISKFSITSALFAPLSLAEQKAIDTSVFNDSLSYKKVSLLLLIDLK